eukprot:scaffold35962_cov45-Isochrysis_galbana.AAC.1
MRRGRGGGHGSRAGAGGESAGPRDARLHFPHLDVSVGADEDILRLEISVNDAHAVQVLQAEQNLKAGKWGS